MGVIAQQRAVGGQARNAKRLGDDPRITDRAGNSGVKYRVQLDRGPVAPEMQILDDAGHPNGKQPLTRAKLPLLLVRLWREVATRVHVQAVV